jgi:hypothetical protein
MQSQGVNPHQLNLDVHRGARLGQDIAHAERRLVEVRAQISEMQCRLPHTDDEGSVLPAWYTSTTEAIERKERDLERAAAENNWGRVSDLEAQVEDLRNRLSKHVASLGLGSKVEMAKALALKKREETELQQELFDLNEKRSDFERALDVRDAALNREERLAAQRREFEARGFEEWLAGEQPCD